MLPTVVGGYSVLGEREQGTLGPVLTTPVRREELLIGKALAAVGPTTAMGYALFALFVIVVQLAAQRQVVSLVRDPAEIVTIALFTPLLAAFSIWVGIAISARSSDVRVAQQLSALAMLPMVGVLYLFAFRVITPTVAVAVVGAGCLAVLDLGAWKIVSAMFDRERLLTRYGGSWAGATGLSDTPGPEPDARVAVPARLDSSFPWRPRAAFVWRSSSLPSRSRRTSGSGSPWSTCSGPAGSRCAWRICWAWTSRRGRRSTGSRSSRRSVRVNRSSSCRCSATMWRSGRGSTTSGLRSLPCSRT